LCGLTFYLFFFLHNRIFERHVQQRQNDSAHTSVYIIAVVGVFRNLSWGGQFCFQTRTDFPKILPKTNRVFGRKIFALRRDLTLTSVKIRAKIVQNVFFFLVFFFILSVGKNVLVLTWWFFLSQWNNNNFHKSAPIFLVHTLFLVPLVKGMRLWKICRDSFFIIFSVFVADTPATLIFPGPSCVFLLFCL